MKQENQAVLHSLALHWTGNVAAGEGLRLSEHTLEVHDEIKPLLLQYFLSSFRSGEYFNFTHPTSLELNELFHYASAIFDDPESILGHSQSLARLLHRCSTHPKVKSGEFCMAFLKNMQADGCTCDAIGIFKSESKETYLKVFPVGNDFGIGSDDGININRLDKGCLVFNTCREEGYMVQVVDNLNREGEAAYWRDQFLQVKPRSDSFHNTRAVMDLCKRFVTEKLPESFEVSRADQVELLNRSLGFMKQNDAFDMEGFGREVLGSPAIIDAFAEYKEGFCEESETPIPDRFDISDSAVKKQARFMKSVIKLDKNFHIYIHGDRQFVERGWDDARKLNYYRLYFAEES